MARITGMDDRSNTNTRLLTLQSAGPAERTAFCPEDQVIAEYYDDVLSGAERDTLEHHLADCHFCLARLGMLQRLEYDPVAPRICEDVLATAKALHQGKMRRPKWAPAFAAAAVLAIALGVMYQLYPVREIGQDALPRTHAVEPSSNLRDTRNIDTVAMGPRFLSPGEGVSISPAESQFTWTAVPTSLYYQVRIVSDSGDLLWQERVEVTEWKLPAGLQLRQGVDYFVRVDAYLTDAKTLQSNYLLFRLGERG
jgi:hypothetical protein